MWYSRKYDMSPMPYSVFFRGGYAIHGTGLREAARHAGLAWLRAAAYGERRDLLFAGQAGRAGQHAHRTSSTDADGIAERAALGAALHICIDKF